MRDILLLLSMKVHCTLQAAWTCPWLHSMQRSHFICELIESEDRSGLITAVIVLRAHKTLLVSEIKQDHPLNLSISLSGGKEIN